MNNNWLWKDLYVWPEGRLSRAGYLLALFRTVMVYVFATQILTAFSPVLLTNFNDAQPLDIFGSLKWAQVGAVIVVAFPIWSLFQRRVNDMRPDIREKLNTWSVAFPLFLVGLIGLMVANSAGLQIPLDDADLGQIRFWFAAMLLGAALIPGGDTVPESAVKKIKKENTNAAESALGQINLPGIAQRSQAPWKPQPRSTPRHQPIPANPVMANQAVQRQHKLPEQGRVKPGWFS